MHHLTSKKYSLIIDTVANYCSVGLSDNQIFYCENTLDIGTGHAEKLPIQVQDLLQNNNININELKNIIVNIGPGSFTGIRVGIAFARALSLALNIEIIGVQQMQAFVLEAPAHLRQNQNILLFNKAYQDFCYMQIFNAQYQMLTQARIISIHQITETIKNIANISFILTNEKNLHNMLEMISIPFAYKEYFSLKNFLQAAKINAQPALPFYIREVNAKINNNALSKIV